MSPGSSLCGPCSITLCSPFYSLAEIVDYIQVSPEPSFERCQVHLKHAFTAMIVFPNQITHLASCVNWVAMVLLDCMRILVFPPSFSSVSHMGFLSSWATLAADLFCLHGHNTTRELPTVPLVIDDAIDLVVRLNTPLSTIYINSPSSWTSFSSPAPLSGFQHLTYRLRLPRRSVVHPLCSTVFLRLLL